MFTQTTPYDFRLIKMDTNGDSLWSVSFGGPDGSERCRACIQDTDSGFVLAGETSSFSSAGYDFQLLKNTPDNVGLTGLSSGIYFARLTAGEYSKTQKLSLAK